MAIEQIGIGGQSAQLKLTTFERRLLTRFRGETIFNRFGKGYAIGPHGGKSINIRKLEAIFPAGNAGPAAAGSAPTALTEGTPPAAIQATWTEIAATISQYGKASNLAVLKLLKFTSLPSAGLQPVAA